MADVREGSLQNRAAVRYSIGRFDDTRKHNGKRHLSPYPRTRVNWMLAGPAGYCRPTTYSEFATEMRDHIVAQVRWRQP